MATPPDVSPSPEFKAAYYAPVDRLLMSGPGWSGIGTPEQWEERARQILRAVRRLREAGQSAGPVHFFDALEEEGI